MEWSQLALLLGSGLAAGYIAGLIGVGGGVIFAPVLFFYFQSLGIATEVIAPLTIGTSLFCTVIASLSSTWYQYKKGSILTSVAIRVGLFSAVAIFLMTQFVTTQPWYDGTVFQIVFSVVLLIVVSRMLVARNTVEEHPDVPSERKFSMPLLAGSGSVAGLISSAAGVGGGVVLVPAYHNLFHIPMHLATGTSSASIVIISTVGILNYVLQGRGIAVPPFSLGYVDVVHGLLLAVPSIFSARAGVWTAHRIDTRALRWSFGVIAAIIAVRLLIDAL